MKKYLVKITSTGTATNPNFAGVSNTWWSGKGSLTNSGRDVFERDSSNVKLATRYLAKEYGYDSERAAKVGLAAIKKFHDEETSRYSYHTFEHSIVAVEV